MSLQLEWIGAVPVGTARVAALAFPQGTVATWLRDARLHAIDAEEEFRAPKSGRHQDASWAFLQQMRELGQNATERWLAADFGYVGTRSTLDLPSFVGPVLEPTLGI
jgi:hypothetical protein